MSASAEPAEPAPAEPAPAPRIRFGIRARLIGLFTLAFTLIFACVFWWVYTFTASRARRHLQDQLDTLAAGTAKLVDGDALAGLYRDGRPDADGFSADPRYARALATLEEVHTLDVNALPYTFVRGDAPDTRRIGARAERPEFVYLVDTPSGPGQRAHFLESDHGSAWALAAWNELHLVERPDLYADKFGEWMTAYAPVFDKAGARVAILGVDYDAGYVRAIQADAKLHVAIVFAIAYAVVLVLVFVVAGLLARPVVALTRATEALHEQTLGTELALGRSDEIGALARAFNRMSARLARAFGDLASANEVLEDRVAARTAELASERERADRLLRNVLPAEIAERLKREPAAIADGFDAVTVLFADIAGFTALASRAQPAEVVALLDQIFSAFDALTDRYALEKIKTIGDAYMVVGGLPTPRPEHAIALADMALAMMDVVAALEPRYPGIALRIGAHIGPVVAGVLGTRKFSYDLWGDTVNIASRMESHGEPGKIQVSAELAAVLAGAFELEPRGAVTLKNRGEMQTFWLVRRKPA